MTQQRPLPPLTIAVDPELSCDEPTVVGQRPDGGLERLRGELFAENLPAMHAALQRCAVEHVSPGLAGFNFPVFVANLRGMARLDIGPVRLFTLMTRNNAFLLSPLVAEELHDLAKGFMDLKLDERVILLQGGKRLFLFRLPSRQLEELRRIANHDRILTARAFPFGDIEQFRGRVADCLCPSRKLHLAHFAAGVPYHRVTAGLPEEVWVLYIDHPRPPAGAVLLISADTKLALVKVSST